MYFEEFLNVNFTKPSEDHRISTNIDIDERLWTSRFGANGTSFRFICRNRFLYLGTTMKFWTLFHHNFFFHFFCYWWKKTIVMKSLSIYFGQHSLAFLNTFLSILKKYNVSTLNKYNLEQVIYALFINLFLQYFGSQGLTRWGPRTQGPKIKTEGRGPTNINIPQHVENSNLRPNTNQLNGYYMMRAYQTIEKQKWFSNHVNPPYDNKYKLPVQPKQW